MMLPFGNQRWRGRRDLYKPPEEPIPTREYEIAEIPGDREAKAFVQTHHYAATYPAARFRYGLYHHGDLVGVAVFSHPSNDLVLTSVFPGDLLDSVELGRFVLLDSVPGNGETWFLARTFERKQHHPARSAAGGGGGRRGAGRVAVVTRERESLRVTDGQRLFHCDRCSTQVVICGRCDRGQRYCGPVCARAARRESQRASNRRYQATPRGRQLHAERQARYRQRRIASGRVTEQGRQVARAGVWERSPLGLACPVCGAARTPFLRLGPRQRHRLRPPRSQGPISYGFW
jgi:hypothetical protein